MVVFGYLFATTFTIEECSWRNVYLWWEHITFEAYRVYVMLMKSLRSTNATIYICVWCRPVNPNISVNSLDYPGSVRWQHVSAPQLCLGN